MMENLITLDDLSEPFAPLPREQTLELRSQFIPKACKLHFEKSPMKVIRANGQYLYDDTGSEYLDCVNCVAHVGHCHPAVVNAAKTAMLQMGNVSLGVSDVASEYVTKLKATFPPEIDTFLFVTSGSEANDLAIQMARQYTSSFDVVSVERNFHGGLSATNNVSPRQFTSEQKCPEWVHVLHCPDLYRGKYRSESVVDSSITTNAHDDPTVAAAIEKYCKDATRVIRNAVQNKKRKLACFICEPLMTVAGIIVPPSQWIHHVYATIRSYGGLVIADEVQSGLGRCGASIWCFQMYENLTPDVITIGKPMGNGFPMACIATKSYIAAKFTSANNYACDLVSAAIGLAVLNTVRSLSLQKNAKSVGDFLREGIKGLAGKHANIGQVRGTGLMIGVEIVNNQESRKPAREMAERICYKMLEHFIVIANDGIHKNILILTPPMCFTCENAHCVLRALDKVLTETVAEEDDPGHSIPAAASSQQTSIIGQQLLSFDEFVTAIGEDPGNIERPGSSSGSNRAEIETTSSSGDGATPDTLRGSTNDMEDESDSDYAIYEGYASMD